MKTGMNCFRLAAAAAVVLCALAAMAQRGQGGFGGGFGGGTDPATLLSQEPVQKELELSDDQKTQVTKLSDDIRQVRRDAFQGLNFGGGGGPPSPEDQQKLQAKMDELTKANKKKIADVLLPPQVERLDQIALQVNLAGNGFAMTGAASAFTAEDLAKKLGITDEQKTKLTDLVTEGGKKIQEMFQGGGGPPDQQEMAKLRTEFKDKAFAILTDEQKTKLEKLQGKKFDTTSIQLGGRRGGRGPGGAAPGA